MVRNGHVFETSVKARIAKSNYDMRDEIDVRYDRPSFSACRFLRVLSSSVCL